MVILAVLSDAQDSIEDGKERRVGQIRMTPETKATKHIKKMVTAVEKQTKTLLKSRGFLSKWFKTISYRSLRSNKGKIHFMKV